MNGNQKGNADSVRGSYENEGLKQPVVVVVVFMVQEIEPFLSRLVVDVAGQNKK